MYSYFNILICVCELPRREKSEACARMTGFWHAIAIGAAYFRGGVTASDDHGSSQPKMVVVRSPQSTGGPRRAHSASKDTPAANRARQCTALLSTIRESWN
jgi:hypothetical protein